jgi:hypothetical protein
LVGGDRFVLGDEGAIAFFDFCLYFSKRFAFIMFNNSSKGKAMIQTLAKVENQCLVKRDVTWEQFKTLQSAFDEIGGVRMVYSALR